MLPCRFSFRCRRPDGVSSCFRDSVDGIFYTGTIIDGNKFELDVDEVRTFKSQCTSYDVDTLGLLMSCLYLSQQCDADILVASYLGMHVCQCEDFLS